MFTPQATDSMIIFGRPRNLGTKVPHFAIYLSAKPGSPLVATMSPTLMNEFIAYLDYFPKAFVSLYFFARCCEITVIHCNVTSTDTCINTLQQHLLQTNRILGILFQVYLEFTCCVKKLFIFFKTF